MRSSRALLLGLAAVVFGVLPAAAQEPFYKGKRLTMMINFAAGGPTDIEGRIFAKHLVKHIDAHPNIVVQNQDGAAGLIGTQYLGEVAARDGTHFGYLTGSAWLHVSEPERWRVDFKSYEFIAYQPGTPVHFARRAVPPARHHGALRARVRAARHEGAGRHREGEGPGRRRPAPRDLQGHPHAHGPRYARRAALPIRHGISFESGRAPRAPTWRNSNVLGIAAELSRGGRAPAREDRRGDAGMVRRHQHCRFPAPVQADGGAFDPDAAAALSQGKA